MDPTIGAGLAIVETILQLIRQYGQGTMTQAQLDVLWREAAATFNSALQAWQASGQPKP